MTYLEKSVTKDNLNAAFDAIHHSLRAARQEAADRAPTDEVRRATWRELLGGTDVEILAVGSGGEALAVAKQQYLDGIVIDLRLSRYPGRAVGGRDPDRDRPADAARSYLCGAPQTGRRTGVRYHSGWRGRAWSALRESHERLLEETVLLLHRAEADLSEAQREILDGRPAERCHAGGQEGTGGGRRCAQYLCA